MPNIVLLFLNIALLGIISPVLTQYGDSCNWKGTGRGSLEGQPPGVVTAYLRCTQGTVKWRYPEGAVRVVLRSEGEFRGCIRLSKDTGGVNIFLEGDKQLVPLFKRDDGFHSDRRRCFTSKNHHAVLYLETEALVKRRAVDFSYDLRPVISIYDPMEECKPCSAPELLKAFCTSETVVQGKVAAMVNNHKLDFTELTVQVNSDAKWNRVAGKELLPDTLKLQRSMKCGTRHGTGEFVFMVQTLLGEQVIQCAPRLSEWKHIKRKAEAAGTNECRLD